MAHLLIAVVLLALGVAMTAGLLRRRIDEPDSWVVPDLRLWAVALGLLLTGVVVLVAALLGR